VRHATTGKIYIYQYRASVGGGRLLGGIYVANWLCGVGEVMVDAIFPIVHYPNHFIRKVAISSV
jgi:hypothetical protein